ncbi:MAG TPA: cytochrome C oxidase subunit IV family protein [Opitutaceae bacterium]|jgi:cytochrome c oxidase subunit 4|nr:cytochrome C oxidase subunit IV family protein [Opitutaceae bacterium]
MSAPTSSPAVHGGHELEKSKFGLYVQIAMLLAVITGLELVTVYLPFLTWILVTVLVVLSTVKFMFVIFYFMHLRWDKAFCTILFFIGLVLASGTMWALLKLFSTDAARPLTTASLQDPAALVIRVV